MKKLLTLILFLTACTANAQINNSFVVSPAHLELYVPPGSSKTFSLAVSNNTSTDIKLSVSVEDITAGSDGEGALTTSKGTYSLTNYLSLPQTEVMLYSGETKNLGFTVSVPAGGSLPGVYGAVVFSYTNGQGSSVSNIKVSSRIASGIFVRTTNSPVVKSEVKSFGTENDGSVFFEPKLNLKLAYQNESEVHVVPRGTLTISNMLGREVKVIPIDSWFVLPQSTRTRLIKFSDNYLFGRYTARLNIDNGVGGVVETRSVSFWILPWKILLLLLAILLIGVLLRRIGRNFEVRIRGSG